MQKAKGRKTWRTESVLLGKTFHPTTGPRFFGTHYGVSEKNSMLPSNVEWGHAPS